MSQGTSSRLAAFREAQARLFERWRMGLSTSGRCPHLQKLDQLESRIDEIADRVGYERTGATRERTSIHEAQRLSH